jgi:hypothetical protein
VGSIGHVTTPTEKKRAMSFLVAIAALSFLMLAAYRGFSVILFAPIAALLAVLVTEPSYVLPVYSGLFMDKMVIFVKLYFPVVCWARYSARSSNCRASPARSLLRRSGWSGGSRRCWRSSSSVRC